MSTHRGGDAQEVRVIAVGQMGVVPEAGAERPGRNSGCDVVSVGRC